MSYRGVGNLFTDFWDPSVKTSTWAANFGSWLNWGDTPKLIVPSATDTPADIARLQRAAIAGAESAGAWSPTPRLGVTAEDAVKAANALNGAKWWIIGGALGLGVVAVVALKKGRG